MGVSARVACKKVKKCLVSKRKWDNDFFLKKKYPSVDAEAKDKGENHSAKNKGIGGCTISQNSLNAEIM